MYVYGLESLFEIICISVQNMIFPLPVLMQYFNDILFSYSAHHLNVPNLLRSPFVSLILGLSRSGFLKILNS